MAMCPRIMVADKRGSLGLVSHQPSSRFSERSYPQRIRWRIIKQETEQSHSPLSSVDQDMRIHSYTGSYTPQIHIFSVSISVSVSLSVSLSLCLSHTHTHTHVHAHAHTYTHTLIHKQKAKKSSREPYTMGSTPKHTHDHTDLLKDLKMNFLPVSFYYKSVSRSCS